MNNDNNTFFGCQLTQMSNAYISVLTFSRVMDGADFARLTDDLNDQIRGRKVIQRLEDNRKQIIIIIFYPEKDQKTLDNIIRQIVANCSPNVRVSF